jgi:hypothetical protein
MPKVCLLQVLRHGGKRVANYQVNVRVVPVDGKYREYF